MNLEELVNLKFLIITNYKEKIFKSTDLTMHNFLVRIKPNFLSFFEINHDYKLETKFLAKKDGKEFEYTLKSERSVFNEFEGFFALHRLLFVFSREEIFIDEEIKFIKPISIRIILYKKQILTDSGEIISGKKFFSRVDSFGYKVDKNNTKESIDKLNNYLDSIRKFR